MAKDETRRVRPSALQADKNSFHALKAIPNYQPANQAYTVANIETSREAMEAAQAAEVQAKAAYDSARDRAVAAEWNYHNNMQEADTQVAAQFGMDSDEYQSLGNKKPSEYKRPQRKAKADK